MRGFRCKLATNGLRYYALRQTKDNRARQTSAQCEGIENVLLQKEPTHIHTHTPKQSSPIISHKYIRYERVWRQHKNNAASTKSIYVSFRLNGKSVRCLCMVWHVICINPDRYGNVSILSWVDIRFKVVRFRYALLLCAGIHNDLIFLRWETERIYVVDTGSICSNRRRSRWPHQSLQTSVHGLVHKSMAGISA